MASDKPSADESRKDPIKPDSEESPAGSTPDGDTVDAGDQAGSQANPTPEQAPKRKGGRKPIYATTEERKQRNRQAQAAFRERRTEYIKQLEQTISVQEQTLNNLNAAHRTAADECLMLRYKNSLLERILLEKGIDVQAELQAKHGSPNFGPTHMPASVIPPPAVCRTLLNRHHRRSASSIAPKVEPGYSTLPPIHAGNPLAAGSPKSQRPTPSSHAASPTAPADGFGPSPASSDTVPRGGPLAHGIPGGAGGIKMPGQIAPGPPRMMPPMQTGLGPHAARMGGNVSSAPFYQTPAYQNHLEQLEQEYDAADMMDEGGEVEDTGGGPGPYPGSAYAHAAAAQQQMSPSTTGGGPVDAAAAAPPGGQQQHPPHQQHPHAHPQQQQQQHPHHQQQQHQQQQQQGMSMTQLLDPSMDWDPFGLSASMAFPSSFSFDTSNMR